MTALSAVSERLLRVSLTELTATIALHIDLAVSSEIHLWMCVCVCVCVCVCRSAL